MSTNITTQYSTALSNSTKELTQSVSDLFDFMINKALILCLTIICICILLLIICVVIYKIIKTKFFINNNFNINSNRKHR